LSSIIKECENPFLQVESFDVEEVCEDSDETSIPDDGKCVELPVCGPFRKQSRGRDTVERPEQDLEEEPEDLDTRLARLEREAYEKGFAQGQKGGLALEERQIAEKGKQLEALFSEISDLRAQIYTEAEKELLKMSLLIAKKIIGQEIETNPQIIGRTIRSAMKYLVDKNYIRILINPEDMEEVKRVLPEIGGLTRGGKFQVVEDHAIKRGGCVLESGFGKINATLDDQIEMLEKEIDEELRCSQGDRS